MPSTPARGTRLVVPLKPHSPLLLVSCSLQLDEVDILGSRVARATAHVGRYANNGTPAPDQSALTARRAA